MKIQYLLDENLPPRLRDAALRLSPDIDILRVGDKDAPPLGTSDPDILHYLQKSKRILVTDNRKSMPGHLQDHLKEGGVYWGVIWIRSGSSIGQIAQDLHLIWEVMDAEEWKNASDWIPI